MTEIITSVNVKSLHIYAIRSQWVYGVVFGHDAPQGVAGAAVPKPKLSRHVDVSCGGEDVLLRVDDAEIQWLVGEGYWSVKWRWIDKQQPTSPIGSGIGKYAWTRLSPNEETKFHEEVRMGMSNGWLVPYNEKKHGIPGAILPLIAVSRKHKQTTPVHLCIDYRSLKHLIKSSPGADVLAIDQKLREWRQREADSVVLDIRKAYLQVRLDSSLLKYQVVVYDGKKYAMAGMGFGLNIALKVMHTIVKYLTREFPNVDNFVDDPFMPRSIMLSVKDTLAQFGLPTKPAEELESPRVLGLPLSGPPAMLRWQRRDGANLKLPASLTCRDVFQWCGRIIAHYPVCS